MVHCNITTYNHGQRNLGTNLPLWRFVTRAKQTVRRELGHPPPNPLQSFNIVWGGGGMHFETENSAFLKTQKINAVTQVSQGILSTIVVNCRSPQQNDPRGVINVTI